MRARLCVYASAGEGSPPRCIGSTACSTVSTHMGTTVSVVYSAGEGSPSRCIGSTACSADHAGRLCQRCASGYYPW